jgi:hypothetical protein
MKTRISTAVIALLFIMGCGSSEQKTDEQKQPEPPAQIEKFIVKASNMMYVSIASDSSLVASEADPTKATVFERVELDNGKIALKISNGKYVKSDRNKEGKLLANSDNAWEWETFELIAQDETTVSIKVSQGKFVCADRTKENTLIGNRDAAGEWERFIMEKKQ